ncbi:uncharacterized protein LOC134249956 [Saccostrea cucullata]|uniref:uncharacterized protein LOC134249956 n=1 Tax=Saccostrea cuccullata TaxID=36930 RepID=UPI002ED310F0
MDILRPLQKNVTGLHPHIRESNVHAISTLPRSLSSNSQRISGSSLNGEPEGSYFTFPYRCKSTTRIQRIKESYGVQEGSLYASPDRSAFTQKTLSSRQTSEKPEDASSDNLPIRRPPDRGKILIHRQPISRSDPKLSTSIFQTPNKSTEQQTKRPDNDQQSLQIQNEVLRQRIASSKNILKKLETLPFLETKAYKGLLDVLEKENVAIVTGVSGDGKTFIAYKCLQKLMQIKQMRPLILESHRDWKRCVFQEKRLAILVKNFNGQDIFTAEFTQNLWCHLMEISQNLKTSYIHTNKIILVLRKEILQCFLSDLENFMGITQNNIIDLTEYALSDDEKSEMLSLYSIDQIANEIALFDSAVQFGFPRFCQIRSVHHGKQKTKKVDSNDIAAATLANLEPEFFTILAFVCINGKKIRRNIFQDQCLENSFLNTMISFINRTMARGATRNCLNPVEVADWLSEVYLAKCSLEGEEIYYILHESIFQGTVSIILENYPQTVFQFAPYNMFQFLESKAKDRTCSVDQLCRIKHAIVNRIAFDIQFSKTHDILGYIADLDQWSNEEFLNICVETHELENSIVNLTDANLGFFLAAIIQGNNISLMRLVASYIKKKIMCFTSNNEYIISIASEKGSVEMFTLFEDLGVFKRDILDAVLFKATKANNLPLLSHLIKDHKSLARDLKDDKGYSLLHYAAMSGSKEIIELLVQNGFDPNERSAVNETILHIFARFGNVSDVDWLQQEYTKQLLKKTRLGMSILHYAALNKETDVIEFLIYSLGMDPREKTTKEENILHLACDHGYYNMIEYIIDNFPDLVQSEDIHGLNALHKACRRGHLDAVKVLTKFEVLYAKYSRNGESVLHAACMSKNFDTFKHLFNTFPKLRDIQLKGDTIIQYAAAYGSKDMLMFLLEQGYKASDCNPNRENALHRACKEGNMETVRFICTKYPDLLNAIDNDGLDPMLCSVCSKSLDVVKYIISQECYHKQTSNTGQGILHIACMNSSVHVIQYICDSFPAEMERRDINGKSPVLLGAMNTDLNVIKFLVNNGFNTNCISLDRKNVLHNACYNRNSEILKYLFKTLPSLKYRKDIRGYNLLHCACEARADNAIDILIGEGFDIRSTTFDNLTALDIAFMSKDQDIEMKLIREYKKKHSKSIEKIVLHDISQYQSRLLRSLNTYEYLDLTVSSQTKIGKLDRELLISTTEDNAKKLAGKQNFETAKDISYLYNNLLYFAKYETNTSTRFLERLIEMAISNPKLLSWYIKVAFRFPLEISSKWLASMLPEIKDYSSKEIQKIIGGGICKKLEFDIKSIQPNVIIHSIWAGCKCPHFMGNQNLSNSFDTLVVVSEGLNAEEINMDKYLGIDVYFRDVDTFSKEASEMMRYEDENLSSVQISKTDIKVLMKQHSNITLISASGVKSKGFDLGEGRPPTKLNTVVIYCRIKGIIPLGESMFPKHIGGFPVDVRESVVSFAAGHEGLRMGERIEPTGENTFGTLGGFINIDDNRLGFITCAHVVCPTIRDPSSISDYINHTNPSVSILKENGRQMHIGKTLHGIFNLHQTCDMSIDAALVELTDKDKFPETGHFSDRRLTQETLQKAGFEDHESLFFCDGKIAVVSEITRSKVVKVGAASGITLGEIHYMHPEASIDQKEVLICDRKVRLSGQIEIRKTTGFEYFMREGDSGSFIFILEDGNPPTLKCIGMAVACTKHGTCFMTPIIDVLSSLNLTTAQLTPFKYQYKKDKNLEKIMVFMFEDLEKRLTESMKTTINNNFASVKNDISSNLSSLASTVNDAKDEHKNDISTLSKQLAEVKEDVSDLKNRMSSIEKKK